MNKIIAHRGLSARAPENTLAAIDRAVAIGAGGVEFDVQLARDGVPVVIHDETLFRYTRRKDKVADLTSKQLARTDVGSWFNRKHRRFADAVFARETVPTLSSVLKALAGYSGLIYIELKCDQSNFRELTEAVCDLVRDSPLLPRIIIKSFKLAVIPEVRHQIASVQTAALFAPEIVHFLRRREHIIALAREFGAQQLSVHHSLITRRLCALASDAGMPVTAWTVDDPRWLIRRRSFGITALITNDPERFR